MVITQPTVDDFSDTTVMRVIRKIVNYICNDLVDGINNNDIVSGQFSVQGNQLSGTLTKGDGTTIDIPAATLPSGGGGSNNPYPIAVSMTLSGTTLNFNMTMSNGTPVTGSVDLAPILEGYATDAEVTAIQSDFQEQISGLKLSSTNNNITLNGDSVIIVKTVSGTVSNGNLKISVNGVESGDIPLPQTELDVIYIDCNVPKYPVIRAGFYISAGSSQFKPSYVFSGSYINENSIDTYYEIENNNNIPNVKNVTMPFTRNMSSFVINNFTIIGKSNNSGGNILNGELTSKTSSNSVYILDGSETISKSGIPPVFYDSNGNRIAVIVKGYVEPGNYSAIELYNLEETEIIIKYNTNDSYEIIKKPQYSPRSPYIFVTEVAKV